MSQPRLGMAFEDVRKRVKRITNTEAKNPQLKRNMLASLKNQARLASGEGAVKEIDRELNHTGMFSGRGNKQTGIGAGYSLGGGKWRFQDGKWSKLN